MFIANKSVYKYLWYCSKVLPGDKQYSANGLDHWVFFAAVVVPSILKLWPLYASSFTPPALRQAVTSTVGQREHRAVLQCKQGTRSWASCHQEVSYSFDWADRGHKEMSGRKTICCISGNKDFTRDMPQYSVFAVLWPWVHVHAKSYFCSIFSMHQWLCKRSCESKWISGPRRWAHPGILTVLNIHENDAEIDLETSSLAIYMYDEMVRKLCNIRIQEFLSSQKQKIASDKWSCFYNRSKFTWYTSHTTCRRTISHKNYFSVIFSDTLFCKGSTVVCSWLFL